MADATGMFVTPERAARARFTRPIWSLTDGLLVVAGNPHRLGSHSSLAGTGLSLAVVSGQVQAAHARDAGLARPQIREVPD
jgi:polar amino acid transport system substrate-binding protein